MSLTSSQQADEMFDGRAAGLKYRRSDYRKRFRLESARWNEQLAVLAADRSEGKS
jgi:hypothetical protein